MASDLRQGKAGAIAVCLIASPQVRGFVSTRDVRQWGATDGEIRLVGDTGFEPVTPAV